MRPARLAALLSLLAAPAAAQSLPTARLLPIDLAVEAAREAVAACERQGWRVSAAVVERSGVLKAQLRGDGAGPHTIDSSRRKAYTAASLGAPTTQLDKMIRERPDAQSLREVEGFLILGGGLPIRAGDEVVGGIGVGGAPGGERDEMCAQAGLDKIKDRLR